MKRPWLILGLQFVATVLWALLGVAYARDGYWLGAIAQWVVVCGLGVVIMWRSWTGISRARRS